MSNKKRSIQALFFAGLLAFLALAVPRTHAAADRYVSPLGNDKPANDCSDPTNPCLTIAYAISQAVANDMIELDAGTYVESGLTIDKNLAIMGQGPTDTEVDANGGTDIFTVDASVTRFGLAAMTLHSSDDRALNVPSGSADVEAVKVEMTANSGGAIAFHSSGSLLVKNSDIHNNVISTSIDGAGIYCGSSGCGDITVLSSSLNENETAGRGGAISSYGSVTIEDSELNDNVAQAAGAIQMDLEPLIIRNSTLDGNEATLLQGGAIFADGDVLVVRSTLSNNFGHPTNTMGGAIGTAAYSVGDIVVINSTFSGNSAGWGGAIAVVASASAEIVNSTFTDNSATYSSGAFYFGNDSELSNSIVTNNDGDECTVPLSVSVTGEHNLIDDATCGSGATFNLGTVTNFDSVLQNNGGPTMTHAILSGSNAIDAGFDSCRHPNSGSPLRVDQRKRGYSRPVDGDSNGVAICDIGAIELQ